ncbi:hypothetical protein [Saccharopolyspora sp. NPDC002578]
MFSMRGNIRQRRFPPEFRIEPAAVAAEPAPSTAAPVVAPEQAVEPQAVVDLTDPVLAEVVTHLWRTTRKVLGEGTEPDRSRRPGVRHLRAAWEALAAAGIEAHDHDRLDFDPGMALDVSAYEPRPGITREVVVETVRPSVYRADRCIQVGQVIVGRPKGDNER